MQSQLPFEAEEGINSLSCRFEDDVMSNVSNSEDEEQYKNDFDIEIGTQENLDPYPKPIPNQKPKWAQNLIKSPRNVVGDPYDRRRTRS